MKAQKWICLIILSFFLGCKNKTECICLINKADLENKMNNSKAIKDTLFVIFANNPHNFDAKNYISFSFGYKTTLIRKFENRMLVDKSEILDSLNINVRINRFVEYDEKSFCIFIYGNKETIKWLPKCKYMYVSFSPSNDNTDEVQFYLSDIPAYN